MATTRTVVARRASESTVFTTSMKIARYFRPSVKVSKLYLGQKDQEAERPTSANKRSSALPCAPPTLSLRS